MRCHHICWKIIRLRYLVPKIEALIVGLGGEVREGEGSRVAFELKVTRKYLHRPHPGKEAKKYQVEELRDWLLQLEIKP